MLDRPTGSVLRLSILSARFLLLTVGVLLLLLILPRTTPWEMKHVIVQYGRWEYLKFQINALDVNLEVPRGAFLGLCLIAAIAQIVLTREGREALRTLSKHPVAPFAALFSAILFSITLFPGLEVGWLYAKTVTISLILGGCAFTFIAGNVGPLLRAVRAEEAVTRRVVGIWDRLSEDFGRMKLWVFLLMLFVIEFLAANAVSYWAFERIPHIQDSIAQVFHAMIFAGGKLTAASPPMREFFDFTHIINNGQWYSQYPPGHTVLLTLGLLAGVPWMVNPLIGSVTIVVFYFLGRELYSDAVGRLAALFGLLSPFILFMSSEFMNHASAMLFFALFLLFFARSVRTRGTAAALFAGIALGWLINIRPYTAVGLTLPILGYGAYLLAKRPTEYLRSVTAFISVVILFVAFLLLFNYLTNGSPFVFGYEVLYGPSTTPGFGKGAWGDPHSLTVGIRQTLDNLVGLNKYLFEWPLPSLIPMFALFCALPSNRWDYILFGAFFSLSVLYVFYWYQDWCFGPRYLYEATPALVLLSVRGLEHVPTFVRGVLGIGTEGRVLYARLMLVVALCFGLGLTFNVPALFRVYSSTYWGVNAKVLKAVEAKGITNAVVFTRSYYGSVITQNSPFLDSDVIYVRDRGELLNREFLKFYPGYSAYIATGDRLQRMEP